MAAALLLALLVGGNAGAQRPAPTAAIVIDDIGNLREEGLRALELPGPLTYAVLPHTPHAATLARLAHALDKEVLVHLPMEATTRRSLGPGALTSALEHAAFEQRVSEAFASVPHARGVSNHMGSKLTTMQRPMAWLMELIAARRGWLFLDSRTTADTVAEASARCAGVQTTSRDVFLDNEVDVAAIRAQLRELLATAQRDGTAVGIAHPYPETLWVLAQELPAFAAAGVTLAPLSRVIQQRATTPVRVARGM
jgi:hypothetical protein